MSQPNYIKGYPVEADRKFDQETNESAFYGRKFNCIRNFGHYESDDTVYCAKCPQDIKTKCMEISKLRPELVSSDKEKLFPPSMLSKDSAFNNWEYNKGF